MAEPLQSRSMTFSSYFEAGGDAVDIIQAAPTGYVAVLTSWYFSSSTTGGGGLMNNATSLDVWGISLATTPGTWSGVFEPGLMLGVGPFTYFTPNTDYVLAFTGYYVSVSGAG